MNEILNRIAVFFDLLSFKNILFFYCLINNIAFAQLNSLPFLRLSDEQGLPNNEVITVMQDQYGYMWFGTSTGLSRFDGYSFVNFKHSNNNPNSLLADKIWTLYEDKQGIIWIGTELGGLNRYDPDTGLFKAYTHRENDVTSISHNYVRKIIAAKDDKLWIGTSGGGLNLFDPKTETFIRFQHEPNNSASLAGKFIRDLVMDREGGLWIGTRSSGLDFLTSDHSKFQHFKHQQGGINQIASNMIQSVLLTPNDELFISTWDAGISRLSLTNKKWKHYNKGNSDLQDNAVIRMVQTKQGALWLGTATGGLHYFDPEKEIFSVYQNDPTNDKSLPANSIWGLTVDNHGFIWVATWGAGVAYVNPNAKQFIRYQHVIGNKNSIASGAVEAIAFDHEETMWIGVNSEGISALEKGKNKFTHYIKNPNNDVVVIYPDPIDKNILWLGTRFGGPIQFDLNTRTKTDFFKNKEISFQGSQVVTIFRDSRNNLWIGTGTGLGVIDMDSDKITVFKSDPNVKNSLSDSEINIIFEDSKKQIWLGTNGGGLNRFDQKSLTFTAFMYDPNKLTSLSHNSVRDIVEDDNEALWISTGQGLNRLTNISASLESAQFQRFGDKKFVSILQDSKKNLWLSGQKGIYQFNPQTKKFNLFDVSDGALSRFSYLSKFQDQDGYMYFSGYDGAVKFNPDQLVRSENKTKVILSYLILYNQMASSNNIGEAFNKRIEKVDTIFIPYYETAFTLQYSALNYSLLNHVNYQYRLNGFNSSWKNTNLNQLTYTNLDPGQYGLEIRASDKNGVWGDSSKLNIVIEPPPWRTLWAYAIYIIIFITLFRYYLHIQERKLAFKALEKISLSDQLTGLKNRYFIDRYIQSDIDLSLRHYQTRYPKSVDHELAKADLVFYLIDIDHFKKVNDQYGHQAGDLILKQMRELMEKVFRKSDYLVRWGGEEFLVVARYTKRCHAIKLAERFRQSVEKNKFQIGNNVDIYITCSIGFASFPFITSNPELISWTKVLEIADHCLYSAKKSQRNAWVGLTENELSDQKNITFEPIRHDTSVLIKSQKICVFTSVKDESLLYWGK